MSCKCFENKENINNNDQHPKIFSEIQNSGQPYKIIEAVINNNRIILRIQKLVEQQTGEWNSSCEYLQESPEKSSEINNPHNQSSNFIMSSPISQNSSNLQSTQLQMETSNETIPNPNVFILRIRKKSETWDRKKENINLEFRTFRPWPQPILKNLKTIEQTLFEVKQNKIIEEVKKDPIPPKNKGEKKKKKKKNKGKKGKYEKNGKKKRKKKKKNNYQ